MVGLVVVGKDVLRILVFAGGLQLSGCTKIVTTPVKAVVAVTLKPAKIVTDATVDLIEKPVRKAVDVAGSAKSAKFFRKP